MRIRDALRRAFCKLLVNVTSRKFLAFVVATWLVVNGHIDAYAYAAIALAFIGAQGYLDAKPRPQWPRPSPKPIIEQLPDDNIADLPTVPLDQPYTGSM